MPVVKNPSPNPGDMGTILGREDFPREGNGNPLQDPSLENSMDKGAEQATVHRGGKESDTTENKYINYTLTYKKSSIRVMTP